MTAFLDWMKEMPAKCKSAISGIRITKTTDKVKAYKFQILKGLAAISLIAAASFGGNEYVRVNTHEIFHVTVNGAEAGIIGDPELVNTYISERNQSLSENHPDVHIMVDGKGIQIRGERVFRGVSDDQGTLRKLDEMITPYAVGAKLIIDGETVGIVKDEETAKHILEQIQEKYVPKEKKPGEVRILSADGAGSTGEESESKDLQPGESELESVSFAQKVDIQNSVVQPDQIVAPEELLNKLVTGSVQPTKYTVEKGDCVSCIAKKFNISKQVVYQNNPGIEDDMIKIGQVLDLTVLQPALTVNTVEKIVENQEIQYDTNYIKDDSLRAGVVVPVSAGKNGLKKVTYEVTKANGLMQSEEVTGEDIIEEPVTAVAKKGTRVVLGEGTGKFAWPVVSPTITSGFGYRWGALHKGLDLVSSNRNILAADNGKVITAGYKSDYGNYVVIDHMNGYKTLYGHMSKIYTSVGKIVEKGENIGYMGATGDATGVHLHFEIQHSSTVENPLKYLNR